MKIGWIAASAMAMALAGCGGGSSSGGNGGGDGGGGGTINRPPSFTSSANVTATEQRDGETPATAAQLAASDADGDALAFSILAGKDGALFQFSATAGALSFIDPPSFETPVDANADNVYEVDVRVSDGTATTTQALRVTLANSTEGVTVTRIATGLDGDAHVVNDQFANLAYVVSRAGRVTRVNPATGAVTELGTIAGLPAGAEILDVVPTEVARSGLSIVVRSGTNLTVTLVDRNDPSIVQNAWTWNLGPTPEPVEASLWVGGGSPYLAIGDGGLPAAAQDPTNPLGNVYEVIYFIEPRRASWGLRSPKLVSGENRLFSLDRGPQFNEFNSESFNSTDRNFEWPIRDGNTDLAYTGPVLGNRAGPRLALRYGERGIGRWLDAVSLLAGPSFANVVFIADDQGNMLSYDFEANGPLEIRNLDFAPNAGTITRIVSMDGGGGSSSPGQQIFMLDADGELFRARLQQS